MNGYFRLVTKEDGLGLMLCPPVGDGEKIRQAELKEYLGVLGIPYNVNAINSALLSLGDDEIVVPLGPIKLKPVDEKVDIQVMADKMTVILRLFAPSDGGKQTTREHVMEQLGKCKVKAGIDDKAIDMALEHRLYCTDVIVAKGKLPTVGRDASIEYLFDTNNDARPALNDDGTVDFFKLNTLHRCVKDQVLAEIIPEERGENGFDVFGNVMVAREVKKATFAHGRNLEISSDGRQLKSMVDGHVSLVEGKVFVTDVYSVENVGTSTGNIEYHGNVEVTGNVCENFSVKTDGNVVVAGVVEGAVIEAGGDIVIARGMHGQNKGRLKAGGNVIAKFISAASVEANGYVEAEQILNAKVTAGSDVNADAGKGLITGGRVVAKSVIRAKNVGSTMGAATVVEVGADPSLKKRLAELQKSVGERTKTIPQMKKAIEDATKKLKAGMKLTADQIRNVKAVQDALAKAQADIQEELKEIESLDRVLRSEGAAHIDVRGTMYQGVAVSISGASMNVKKEYTFCRLIKKGADIASTNL